MNLIQNVEIIKDCTQYLNFIQLFIVEFCIFNMELTQHYPIEQSKNI
jgi:hypothetical protein